MITKSFIEVHSNPKQNGWMSERCKYKSKNEQCSLHSDNAEIQAGKSVKREKNDWKAY